MSGNRGRIEVLRERSFAEMRRLDATERALLTLNKRVLALEPDPDGPWSTVSGVRVELEPTYPEKLEALVRKLAALEPAPPAYSYQNNLITEAKELLGD